MSIYKHISIWQTVFLCLTMLGCDQTPQSETRLPLVEAYLEADAPFPAISVRQTLLLGETFLHNQPKELSANVQIYLLDEHGNEKQTIHYYNSPDSLGLYLPIDPSYLVRPGHSYRLKIQIPELGTYITGETLVPGLLQLVKTNGVSFKYGQTPSYQATISPCTVIQNRTCQIIFSATSLEVKPDHVVPFWQAGNNPFNLKKTPHIYSSPMFNEGNYPKDGKGNMVIDMLWISITHYGKTRVNIHTIDQNMADFYRSQSQQQQLLGRFGPGEMPNAISHLKGAVGVFGSYSTLTNVIEVHP